MCVLVICQFDHWSHKHLLKAILMGVVVRCTVPRVTPLSPPSLGFPTSLEAYLLPPCQSECFQIHSKTSRRDR